MLFDMCVFNCVVYVVNWWEWGVEDDVVDDFGCVFVVVMDVVGYVVVIFFDFDLNVEFVIFW